MKSQINHTVTIQHETFGIILKENFIDATQFKLFLQMIQGCLELENDLTFFDGSVFLVHIPHKHLKDSIILTKLESWDLTEHLKSKVKGLQNV